MGNNDRRDEFRERFLRAMPKGGVVAEIGVWRGSFSEKILDICKPDELHLVDPWSFQPEFPDSIYGRERARHKVDEHFEFVTKKFADDDRVRIYRETSDDAWALFPDAYFDWVYIDGNHNEPFISRDLANALRKTKRHGMITGDDYYWKFEEGAPIKAAVERFMATLGGGAHLELIESQYIILLNHNDG